MKGEGLPSVNWRIGPRLANGSTTKINQENFLLVSYFSTLVESSFHNERVVFEIAHENYFNQCDADSFQIANLSHSHSFPVMKMICKFWNYLYKLGKSASKLLLVITL